MMAAHNLDTIFLAAPTSPDQRLKAIAQACKGFVYAVSRTGITGTSKAAGDRRSRPAEANTQVHEIADSCRFWHFNAQQFSEVAANCGRRGYWQRDRNHNNRNRITGKRGHQPSWRALCVA